MTAVATGDTRVNNTTFLLFITPARCIRILPPSFLYPPRTVLLRGGGGSTKLADFVHRASLDCAQSPGGG